MANDLVTYIKNGDGFINNTHYKDGVEVKMHPRQVKYLLPPLGNDLREQPVAKAAKPVKAAPKSAD